MSMSAGCTFANLGGGQPPISVTGAGSSASFTNCTFSATSTTDLAAPAAARSAAGPPAVNPADAASAAAHAYSVALADGTAVRVEDCAFADGAVAAVRVEPGGGATAYSDVDSLKVLADATGTRTAAKPLTGIVDAEAFLGREDAWLVETQQV